jgi:hypothetical protein
MVVKSLNARSDSPSAVMRMSSDGSLLASSRASTTFSADVGAVVGFTLPDMRVFLVSVDRAWTPGTSPTDSTASVLPAPDAPTMSAHSASPVSWFATTTAALKSTTARSGRNRWRSNAACRSLSENVMLLVIG